MEDETKKLIDDTVAASHAGTGNFGEQVMQLMAHGVESYRVDFRERTSTYFLPSGSSYRVSIHAPEVAIGDRFDAAAILEAIRGSQRGDVKYPEFMDRAVRAGCVGYVVWIAGRHVTYFGRRGETHVERFPGT
jgi:uncharacterized protein YbcV (DUF1398 family)